MDWEFTHTKKKNKIKINKQTKTTVYFNLKDTKSFRVGFQEKAGSLEKQCVGADRKTRKTRKKKNEGLR